MKSKIDKRLEEIDDEMTKLSTESLELQSKNRVIKGERLVSFLKKNLNDLDFEAYYNENKQNIGLVCRDWDSENKCQNTSLRVFLETAIEIYSWRINQWSNLSFSFNELDYDYDIEIYAKDKYEDLHITIRDISQTNDFLTEFGITGVDYHQLQDDIDHCKETIEQLEKIKSLVK